MLKHLISLIRHIPGTADVTIQQTMSTPTLLVNGNRTFMQATGLTETNLATNELLTLSGSGW